MDEHNSKALQITELIMKMLIESGVVITENQVEDYSEKIRKAINSIFPEENKYQNDGSHIKNDVENIISKYIK